MQELRLNDEIYGPLLPYIQDENITDINWNGESLWLDDLKKGRYPVDTVLDTIFVQKFTHKIANLMSQNFNKYEPLLEAETDNLRVSILHEDRAKTGRSISIRKTPAKRRLTRVKMLNDGYCPQEIDNFMQNMVSVRSNIIIAGLPGVGKTEYVKTLTGYIPKSDRAITIEDNLELRYRAINPGKDVVEIKVDEDFSYADAIKTCLRQRPDWILLSEARSVEVKYLLESMSTGTNCITTVHTDDVRKIPQRIQNMMPPGENLEKVETDIYSFIDVGILIDRTITENNIERHISQLAVYSQDEITGEKKIHMIYENGIINMELPEEIKRKFKKAGIKNPFQLAGDNNEETKEN